ncbi:DNA-methyltransferase [Jannaschia seohaensis]|uniref:Methyltransferase n=1 Tax=Jannaschia seohaensis TaxID=475081 RepID=A0A2Y9AFH0_9RHOB|nr:site-specific DNA-methyltransferase [Jannaschia seohaensis]PWJ21422.1 site-specific DNA-methyltransferase (adenine-specific) [Jannaschia seohaensis]SSA42028.1 site-specific DNA-methyltransferase (adenine-specific) [Jannaschia seohaensis]
MILVGDATTRLRELPAGRVHTCVTSPPYFGLRDYGVEGQIGREDTVEAFIARLVDVFREVRRVLRDDGTLWLNIGDTYVKKQRLLVPARVALAMQADGWLLRDEVIWHKPRTTPSPVKDRTVAAHEMIYLFSKRPRYAYDYRAIEEPAKYPNQRRKAATAFRRVKTAGGVDEGRKTPVEREIVVGTTRRKRSVWSVNPAPYKEAHFATFPPDLIEPCVLAGAPRGGTVLDPFGGSGTTAGVAEKHGRRWVLCEVNPDYAALAKRRIAAISGRSSGRTVEDLLA